MTKLIKAANPEELQQKLEQLFESDEEDRPWYESGPPTREDGYWYQFLSDQSPTQITITHQLDTSNLKKIVKIMESIKP